MKVTIRAVVSAACAAGFALPMMLFTGCGASASLHGGSLHNSMARLRGSVHGGQQPISGSTVQLYAAGTSGYGVGAQALLSVPVLTDQNGDFDLSGTYSCQLSASGQALPADGEVYLVATGGNAGLIGSANIGAISLMAALGPCSGLSSSTFIVLNEVTTVASVWPLAPFMSYGAQVGTSAANMQGLATAFLNVNTLVNIAAGQAPGASQPAPGVTVPVAEINTLADILASCINSDGTTACHALFNAATPPGGQTPTNTLDAALDIALNPTNNVTALYNFVSPYAPFQPTLASAPTTWSLGNSIVSNPVPHITSLSPASLLVGSAAQPLTINGSNFLSTSTVTYNGVAHPATYISADQLTIQLSAADISSLGIFPVVVSNPVPGGGTSTQASVQVYGEAQNSTVAGSIAPSSSYELDGFDVQGKYAYILGDNASLSSPSTAAQLYVVDVSQPANLALVSTTSVIGSVYYGESGLRAQGQYVYLVSSTGTADTNLLQVYDVSNPSSPMLTGSVQVPLYGIGLWVSGNYAYVISYVGYSAKSTLAIVDISNPASPQVVGVSDTGTPGVNVADIKVAGNYAYVSGQSGSTSYMLVFDVSNPASPYLLSSLPVPHSPQGLDVQGQYMYVTFYDQKTLVIYDISNPSALIQVGVASLDSTCKAQDVSVEGTTAYVDCYTNSSVAVVDVTQPASPVVDGSIALPATSYPLATEAKGRYVYSISNAPGGQFSVIDTGGS